MHNNSLIYKYLLDKFKLADSSLLIKMTNRRTNVVCTSLKQPQLLIFDASKDLIVFENRRYFPHIAAAECAWQFMGTNDAAFININAPKLWSNFTMRDGTVTAAYGYRMAQTWGFNQIEQAIKALKLDDTSRQIWIQIWEPGHDMPNPSKIERPLNVPCVLGFKLTVHNEFLNMHVVMRSSDVLVGLPYDVMVYHMTMKAIAVALGLKCKELSFALLDAHYYERQQKILDEGQWSPNTWISWPHLPELTPKMIAADPDYYVKAIKSFGHNGNKFEPVVVVVA